MRQATSAKRKMFETDAQGILGYSIREARPRLRVSHETITRYFELGWLEKLPIRSGGIIVSARSVERVLEELDRAEMSSGRRMLVGAPAEPYQ